MARPKDPLEVEAQHLLQRLRGGVVVERDVPPAQGMRDFDLVEVGHVRDAVEVTSVQLPAVRGARANMERLRELDLGLTQSWSVTVHEAADLSPVRVGAAALLNELTARGIDRFFGYKPHTDPAVRDLVERLGKVGVVQGYAMSSVTPPRLSASGFGSGSIDPSNVTTAVETELAKPDNRRKLAAAPTGATRNAFVWLHDSHWYVSSTLRDSDFPLPPAPLLPDEVDVVWIAVAEGDPPRVSALLRADREGIEAIDVSTGRSLPAVATSADNGPPSTAPECSVCGGPGEWIVSARNRVAPKTKESEVIRGWNAVCASNPEHFRLPGRALSAKELAEHPEPNP